MARSAEITHVATADTDVWPVEFDASVGFSGTLEQADIAKEQFQTSGNTSTLIHGTELNYRNTTTVLPIRIAGGLWHNLELHVTVPIIINADQHWDYSSESMGGAKDTINKPAGICPEGPTATCANGISANSAQNTLVPETLPVDSNRGGFTVGDITIGAAWTPLNEIDEASVPTWLLGFDYVAPNASPMNPTKVSYLSSGNPTVGDVGDGLHHFHPYTALSKRRGVFDPYLMLWLDFAHAMGNTYDNCQNPVYPSSNGDPRVNCGAGPYVSNVTRLQPEYQGGFIFGSELVPYENAAQFQKVAIDLRFISEYHSEARTYTQLSDLLQELTYQQDYARLGGQLGVALHAGKNFMAQLNFALLHDTDHWLTNENLGAPGNSGTVDVTSHTGSNPQNPNFDFRFDAPGSRFLLQNSIIGSLSASLTAMF